MSSLYDTARRAFLTDTTVGNFSGQIDWVQDNFKAVLIDTNIYTFNAAHQTMDDVQSAARVAVAEIENMDSDSQGTALGDNTLFEAVTGDEVGAVLIFRDHNDAGNDADNVLVAYIDDAMAGLPVTPNGGDITILWDGGSRRIFRL